MNYDIQKISMAITGNTATVSLYFNTAAAEGTGNQSGLGPFSDAGLSLIVGDLFFYSPDTVYDPSNPETTSYLKYAVPLNNHHDDTATSLPTVTPGALYQVGATETAQTALGNPGNVYYRANETVLMTAGSLVSAGDGVTVADFGNGITNALYDVTVSFQTTANFLSLLQNGQIGILFSSADCGNDVIQGAVAVESPEPRSLALIACGLGTLACVFVWRRRKARKAPTA
jgi:hypothetical protein